MARQLTISFLLVCFLFSAQAQDGEVTYIYEEIDFKTSMDTIIAEHFMGETHSIEFIASGKSCKINVGAPLLYQSMVYFSNTCDEFILNPKVIELKDSLIRKKEGVPEINSSNISPHLNWLLQARANTKEITDSVVLRKLSFEKNANDYTKFFQEEKSIQTHLYKTDSANYLISFDAKPLEDAVDLRSLELHPEYPKFVDSTDYGAVFFNGHSVVEIETNEQDTLYNILFVSDEIWDNVQRLKYLSILKVEPFQEFVFILGDAGKEMTNHLFVVDRNKNVVYQINPDFYLLKDEPFVRYISDFEMMEEETYLFLKTAPSYSDMHEVHFNTLELLNYLRSL